MTTTLYRAYDAQARLLYVGISDGEFIRLSQHAASAPWTVHAVKITLERFPLRRLAEDAEKQAILKEDPVWNMAGRPLERTLQWLAAYPGRHADDVSMAEVYERYRHGSPSTVVANPPED